MISVNTINSTTSGAETQSGAPVQTLGKDDFLNLLVTQLQNQDPLNPADSTEFTAQLAQFSSLEQLSNINDSLDNMAQFQNALTNSQAVSYIGKEITAKGDTVRLITEQSAECHFELEGNALLAAISVYDATGGFVKSFETGPLSSGRQSVAWDGTDRNGSPAAPGYYHFEVQAVDGNNENLTATPLISTVVTGVSFKDKTAHLITEIQTVAIDDVIDVSDAVATPDSTVSDSETNDNKPLNGGL